MQYKYAKESEFQSYSSNNSGGGGSSNQSNYNANNDDSLSISVIKVRGLPFTVNETEIVQYFSGLSVEGGDRGVTILFGHDGRPNGEGFVRLSEPINLKSLEMYNKKNIKHRYIEVFPSDEIEMNSSTQRNTFDDPSQGFVIRLRGLPFNITKAEVEKFFEGYRISYDGVGILVDHNDRPTGEAFIQFETQGDADQARKKNNQRIGSRYIEIFKSSMSDAVAAINRQLQINKNYQYTPQSADFYYNGPHGGGGDDNDYNSGPPHRGDYRMSHPPASHPSYSRHAPPDHLSDGSYHSNYLGETDNMRVGGGGGGGGSSGNGVGPTTYGFSTASSAKSGGGAGPTRVRSSASSYRAPPYSVGGGGRDGGGQSGGPRGMYGGGPRTKPGSTWNSTTGYAVHMRGLPYQITEEDIEKFFEPINPVFIEIHRDYNGKPNGEADVDFASLSDAEKSMGKDRQKISWRYIELFLNANAS